MIRIHDEGLAREFYVDYLGFGVEWEHRFEPGMPLYVRRRRHTGNRGLDTCCQR